MSSIEQQYELWDEFLEKWSISRLKKMKLDDYTKAGSQETFTYWLESRLDKMGSYWGGSSFKFGVYSRGDTKEMESDGKHSYSDTHGWYSSLGTSAEEAFLRVREFVVNVATLAKEGDLVAIEAIDLLGEKFRWKIAFHYQDRSNPYIVNVFTNANLAAFVGESADRSMATLQKSAMAMRPKEMDLLEFGERVWESSLQTLGVEIWKLSHGVGIFSDEELSKNLDNKIAVIHKETGKGQGKDFENVPDGTLFFLCHSNHIKLIGQFTSEAMPYETGDGWVQRNYQVLSRSRSDERFTASRKGWSPGYNSTFMKVRSEHLPEFEKTLLKPYFDLDVSKLAAMAEEPIEPGNGSIGQKNSIGSKPIVNCRNRIYYGPPGTGKTYELLELLKAEYNFGTSEQRCIFVTFHQSYGYEEFVEGLRPILKDGNLDNNNSSIGYEIRSGSFKLLCDRARSEPNCRFAMVIDEINRGNVSKIFGELITLIEPDKRERGENPVTVTLPYSGKSFNIPSNVDIFGTMNTADRSLATLDTALRRRFEFIHLAPDTRDSTSAPLAGLRINFREKIINVSELLSAVNRRIETLYDRDHRIGHAYFMSLREVVDGKERFDALGEIFKARILPLLEEYFFEDWEKIRLVLADNQKPAEFQFVTQGGSGDNHEDYLHQMFGADYEIDTYAAKKNFQIQKSALEHPESYVGIYSKV